MTTERHLLFAVLAFESELIDLPQLTAACRAWAEDKSQPLADLLVERGWLTVKNREFIEELVGRKLAKHQHDPRVTLNSVVRGDVCDAIKEVDDSDIQQSLSSWPSSAPVLVETLLQADEDKPKSRYTWISEVGKGGLGRVWLARDNDLAREVALKEIRPDKSTASQEAVRRLIKEAQITGQLQHPNIVPVYEVNRGGRPFYTMKLVKGETLSKAICRHHEQRRTGFLANGGNQTTFLPGENTTIRLTPDVRAPDPLSLPRLLNVFANVCEALAYAHSRGVIHRDLKPENIVLGDYGEAIVLDWGLAKQIGSAEETTAPVIVTEDARSPATHLGATPGTPAYMAPEQAAGRVDLIDQRTDVYGLGAILFEILTGHPPHRAAQPPATGLAPVVPALLPDPNSPAPNRSENEAEVAQKRGNHPDERGGGMSPDAPRLSLCELLKRICDADTPRARATDPSIPLELDAVCAKAMSKRRDERYPDAKALVADVRRYLSDEPVSACPEPFTGRVRRWMQQHRTAAATTAATFLMTFLALLGWGILSVQHTRTVENKNSSLRIKNVQLEQSNKREREARDQAVENAALAREQTARADEEATRAKAVTSFMRELFTSSDPTGLTGSGLIPAGEGSRTVTAAELLESGAKLMRERFQDSSRSDYLTRAAMLSAIGDVSRSIGLLDQSKPLLVEALQIRQERLPADHPDISVSQYQLANWHSERGDFVKAENLYAEVLTTHRRRGTLDTLEAAEVQLRLAAVLLSVGDSRSESFAREGLATREKHLGPHHRETAIGQAVLTASLFDQKKMVEGALVAKTALGSLIGISGLEKDKTLNAAMDYQAGVALARLGLYGLAINKHRNAAELMKKSLGPKHLYNSLHR